MLARALGSRGMTIPSLITLFLLTDGGVPWEAEFVYLSNGER